MGVRVVHDGGVVWDILWICIVPIWVCQGWVVGACVMVYLRVRFWWRMSLCGSIYGVGSYVWVWGVVDCE